MNIFNDYLKSLKTFRISEITESTYRNKLQILLEAIALEINPKIKIIHEPKREGKFGSPDYKVLIADNIIGYVENKPIGEDLDRVLKSEQIRKYKSLSNNLIITNYIEFIWLKDGKVIKRENLSYLTDFDRKKIKIDLNKAQAIKSLIANFFSQAPKGISNSKKLAEALSTRAKLLKDFLFEELKRQQKEHKEGKLHGLFQTFKKYVFTELSIDEFSDTFAQNLVYGLFLAKLNAGTSVVNLYNAKKYISHSFELIKELVGFLDELENEEYIETRWIVEEVLTVMNNLDVNAITDSLSFNKNISNKSSYGIRDPYIYFYEDFLASYDKKLRKSKGVYYTPIPVVNFIIRNIDYVLKEIFNINNGFLDNRKVTVLDFATGTGTFIIEILNNIFENLPEKSGKKDLVIKEHILKNLYGFEYLISPYTIAHLKLSQYLKNKNYILNQNERLQIFLTNTLEPIEKQLTISLLPALSNETNEAQNVKDKPILVITGNPPYNIQSKNKGKWITDLLKDYKPTDEKKLNIDDDYIKFIRFAHFKMQNVPKGIIGIITNNSFLNGITHRKMRGELIKDFDKIFILNLHGNLNINERTPDGELDENVFDIKQGVSINFFIKDGINTNKGKVFYHDLWGKREEKYENLLNKDLVISNFKELDIGTLNQEFRKTKWSKRFKEDFNFFTPFDYCSKIKAYGNYWGIHEIFKEYGTGVKTERDSIAIHFDIKDLINTIRDFIKLDVNDIRSKYQVKDSRDWKVKSAKEELKKLGDSYSSYIRDIYYRPFDKRKTLYTGKSKSFIGTPGFKINQHLLKENLALTVKRQNKKEPFSYSFIVDDITESCFFESSYANNSIFPLFIYDENSLFSVNGNKINNFKEDFITYLHELYDDSFTEKTILGYIYSILHSSTYRKKYSEFLKIDFPRIPFNTNKQIFKKLSVLGIELINAHLLKKITKHNLTSFKGDGNYIIEKVTFKNNRVIINNNQYFDNVSEDIYSFHIGGYPVLEKYLKYRRGRTLTLNEIENFENIVNVIAYTLDQMDKIDDIAKDWI